MARATLLQLGTDALRREQLERFKASRDELVHLLSDKGVKVLKHPRRGRPRAILLKAWLDHDYNSLGDGDGDGDGGGRLVWGWGGTRGQRRTLPMSQLKRVCRGKSGDGIRDGSGGGSDRKRRSFRLGFWTRAAFAPRDSGHASDDEGDDDATVHWTGPGALASTPGIGLIALRLDATTTDPILTPPANKREATFFTLFWGDVTLASSGQVTLEVSNSDTSELFAEALLYELLVNFYASAERRQRGGYL